jgi:hypothetical protein
MFLHCRAALKLSLVKLMLPVFLLLFASQLLASKAHFKFDNIGADQGLFDPASERFGLVQHDPAQTGSLASGQLWAMFKDKSGVLWVGSESGVSRFVHNPQQENSNNGNSINTLVPGMDGEL